MINVLAIAEAVKNKAKPVPEVEELAKKRIEICSGCPHFKKEKNPFFQVSDKRVKKAHLMACNECGCSLPLKIRQSIEKCVKWID